MARECEKRQQLEFQVERLQAKIAEQPEPEYEPVRKDEIISIPQLKSEPEPIAEDEPTGFDWRNVPNAELNGDRRHDAYHEKLRRSVEAIQEYNAGLDDSDQFAITGSLLRQLSKVKPGLVKDRMAEHRAELDGYNAGYGARQNTGKPEPREAIKWSKVYGEYQW